MTKPRALIVWGGLDIHDPRETAAIIAGMLEEDGFAVDVTDDQSVFGTATLTDYRLIVPNITGGEIEPEPLDRLIAAVRGGVGLGGHHASLATTWRRAFQFHYMTGCQWVAHPGDIIDYRVDVTRPDDPIMAGIESFDYRSEQYYMLVDPGLEVLATTTFGDIDESAAGVVMPVVYKRRFGAGRVFYSSLGHRAAEFDHVPMRTILRRGLTWAAAL